MTMANDFVCESRLLEAAADVLPTVRETPSADLRQFRISKRESQEKFWGRFGVTQSSGSRFETGLSIPAPVALLLKLYLNGKLSDGDLLE
jgi:DNA-binding transcriptional regulator YiaG